MGCDLPVYRDLPGLLSDDVIVEDVYLVGIIANIHAIRRLLECSRELVAGIDHARLAGCCAPCFVLAEQIAHGEVRARLRHDAFCDELLQAVFFKAVFLGCGFDHGWWAQAAAFFKV